MMAAPARMAIFRNSSVRVARSEIRLVKSRPLGGLAGQMALERAPEMAVRAAGAGVDGGTMLSGFLGF